MDMAVSVLSYEIVGLKEFKPSFFPSILPTAYIYYYPIINRLFIFDSIDCSAYTGITFYISWVCVSDESHILDQGVIQI